QGGLDLLRKVFRRLNFVAIEPEVGLGDTRVGQFPTQLLPEECYPTLPGVIERRVLVVSTRVADKDGAAVVANRRACYDTHAVSSRNTDASSSVEPLNPNGANQGLSDSGR